MEKEIIEEINVKNYIYVIALICNKYKICSY